MTVDFQNHFWGDKQNGFDVLYQNLKCGSSAVKELAEFLRSRSFLEEYNVNFLTKLSRKTNSPQLGTFHPILQILKSSTDKLSSVHTQTLQRLNQLIKEINKYCDEHHRKQKQIKNEEISTIEAINELKETVTSLNKAKEFYYSKTVEIDRLRRENASQKDIEKGETRVNKAYVEYKNLIEKYQKVKEDFEKKFCVSCQNFQKIEEDHIKQMKNYLSTYSEILESGHALMGQVYQEFRSNFTEMSTEKLLEAFIHSKGTGTNRPATIQFEEANATNSAVQSTNANLSNLISSGSSINVNANKNSSNTYSSSLDLLNQDLPLSIITLTKSNNIFPNSINEFDSKTVNNINHLLPTNSNTRKDGNKFMKVPDIQIVDSKSDTKSYSTLDSLENVSQQSNKSTVNNQKDHHKSFPDIPSNTKTPKWFLRSRRDKTKEEKKKNKKKDSDEESNSGSVTGFKTYLNDCKQKDYTIDSEGYTIRTDPVQDKEESFYSSSDSDSEDEKEKKIFVKINPLPKVSQNSSNVDQLIASATALTLAPSIQQSRRANLPSNPSPVQNDNSIQRSISSTHTTFKSKESDLFGLFVDQSKKIPQQNTSTVPTAFDLSFSYSKRTDSGTKINENESNTSNRTNATNVDRYAAFNELSSSITENSNKTLIDENKTMTSSTFNVLPLPPKCSESISPLNSILTKSISSTSFGSGTNSFSVYKPLYKSSTISSSNGMSRAESIISLSSDFRMTPISLCSSRDSSPLTISMSDTIPVALAFQESVGSCFKGIDENLSKISIIGCIKIAFSAGIIQVLTTNPYLPQLMFKLKNANRLEKIILSKDLIEQVDSNNESYTYEMNMNALQSSIKRLHDQSPNARYYNLDILKYQVCSFYGAKNAPLQLVSHWKCDDNTINLKIDFKYNPSAFTNSLAQPLRNVLFTANIDSNVISMVSQPFGKWDSLTKQATWKYNEISHTTENSGLGSIKAKFDISNGPSCPSSIYVQFSCQDTILSGLDFELIGSGYRLSLVKRQFCAGRYYCEPKIQKP